MKINKKFMSVALAFLLAFSTAMVSSPALASAPKNMKNLSQVEANTLNRPDTQKIIGIETFSNQALFDTLEQEGHDLHDYFTEEEIQEYLAQDNSRAGQTKLVHYSKGNVVRHRLYLSSAYTKVIAVGGSTAVGVIIGMLPITGSAAIGTFVAGLVQENIDTSKGIYINFKAYYIPSGWGYQ